jgi:pyridoxamine 5'-phosphate oxidase
MAQAANEELSMSRNYHHIRKEYTIRDLSEESLPENPLQFFESWLEEALENDLPEPTAMTLSTASSGNQPSSRVVLLKETRKEGLVFFTNYESNKGLHLRENPLAALNFFWPELERQVRFEGKTMKLTPEESDAYFQSRPFESQAAAWVSDQSNVLASRDELEKQYKEFFSEHSGQELKRPAFWGGYLLVPHMIEFWQGRPGRLHDRIRFDLYETGWKKSRLYP